jgi:hypothetical protein
MSLKGTALGAKMASPSSCMLRLTATVYFAHHYTPTSLLRLTLTHLSSPNITDKATLPTLSNRNRFFAGNNLG